MRSQDKRDSATLPNMPATLIRALALGLLTTRAAYCQQPAPPTRVTGIEPTSHIAYALISTPGKLLGAPETIPPPRLTAQCTRDPSGKFKFELLADFGGIAEITFVPPWTPSSGDLYPPRLDKLTFTMDFLGYTRVKPVKRQWEYLQAPAGELRYATPGLYSTNMEPITFYLQYLKALPTLRLTTLNKPTLEFETTQWQAAIRTEPLCHASAL